MNSNNVYRGMDRSELDAAYSNSRAVGNFEQILQDFQQGSRQAYEQLSCQRNIAYGKGTRHCFDWFPHPHKAQGTFIFIHGGYWQECTKEDFAFIAPGLQQAGFHVVLTEYTLAPQATMQQIVEETGALLDYLAREQTRLGLTGPICLSGHSAGGHLTLQHRNHPLIDYAMPISALVDLEPISLSWLNDALQLSTQEIEQYSPIRHIAQGVPTLVTVGASELPELVRHSRDYVIACHERMPDEQVKYLAVADCHHFSILTELLKPDSVQIDALKQMMASHQTIR
ncbi:MAG: alpha/beta hydrolase [Enterobacteriaceae bacterium]